MVPQGDMEEMNPPKTAAARISEGIDLTGPDRVDDALFNRVLWLALKGDELRGQTFYMCTGGSAVPTPRMLDGARCGAARSRVAGPRAVAVIGVLGDEPADEPGQRTQQLVEQADEADHAVERLQDRADQIAQGSG